ncbi:MAG: PKD domain-containing protein, partial [Bacteroidota bacterium]|nr:PKD domain-containing protein [Bacteroidota bacterium]
DDVYVVGQTHGNYPITPGKYSVAGSSQFIHKYSPDLSSSIWSTRIGNGNGDEDISPSAFLVSDCRQIYFSGWGGQLNGFNGLTSTTLGLPTTPEAFQTTTDGSDFYLMVLEPEAVALNYATFFGGGLSNEHVDGGTSRFDKSGKVYQAVCAGCGGNDDFPTTPGAWSNTNNNTNCNLGVFKFDLSKVIAVIEINGPDSICAPASVDFESQSSGGDTFNWTFGDEGESTEESPSFTFQEPGVYSVTLIVTDSYDCVIGDTAVLQITILPEIEVSVEPVPSVCPGGEVQLTAMPADQEYIWSPSIGLDDTAIQDPIASPGVNTTYLVIVSGECGTDSATVEVIYADPVGSALPDETICLGDSAQLGASGGSIYLWDPPEGLDDPTSSSPLASPIDTTVYSVMITTIEGCEMTDSVQVNVVFSLPEPALVDTAICEGSSVQLIGPVADWYLWEAATGIIDLQAVSQNVSPLASSTYVLLCGNICGELRDTARVDIITVVASAWPDTIVCPGEPVQLHASGGTTYSWSPGSWLNDASSETPICRPASETNYTVTVTDDDGCSDQAELLIRVFPTPFVNAGNDAVIDFGDRIQLHGLGDGILSWEPVEMVDCADCPGPWTRPEESTLYTLRVIDTNNCVATDQVWVILNGSLFVPNTFTPNGDGVNDVFGAWGKEIAEFQLQIFDRWGLMIYESDRLDRFWDGTYSG